MQLTSIGRLAQISLKDQPATDVSLVSITIEVAEKTIQSLLVNDEEYVGRLPVPVTIAPKSGCGLIAVNDVTFHQVHCVEKSQ